MRVHIAAHKIILVIALAALLPSMAFAAAPDWLGGARGLIKAQDWKGLLDYSSQRIKAEPGYPFAWNYLGIAYENLGRYQDAVDAYLEAVRLLPEYEFAWYNLARAYNSLGRDSEATDAITESNRIRRMRKARETGKF